jgi:hypothetical protein
MTQKVHTGVARQFEGRTKEARKICGIKIITDVNFRSRRMKTVSV